MRQKRNQSRGKPNLVDHYSKIGIKAVAASVRYQGSRTSTHAGNRKPVPVTPKTRHVD